MYQMISLHYLLMNDTAALIMFLKLNLHHLQLNLSIIYCLVIHTSLSTSTL